jgi:hypothetical protein
VDRHIGGSQAVAEGQASRNQNCDKSSAKPSVLPMHRDFDALSAKQDNLPFTFLQIINNSGLKDKQSDRV